MFAYGIVLKKILQDDDQLLLLEKDEPSSIISSLILDCLDENPQSRPSFDFISKCLEKAMSPRLLGLYKRRFQILKESGLMTSQELVASNYKLTSSSTQLANTAFKYDGERPTEACSKIEKGLGFSIKRYAHFKSRIVVSKQISGRHQDLFQGLSDMIKSDAKRIHIIRQPTMTAIMGICKRECEGILLKNPPLNSKILLVMNDSALLFEYNQDSITLADLISNSSDLDWAMRYYIALDVASAVCHLHEHYLKAVDVGASTREEKLSNCIDFYLTSAYIDVHYGSDSTIGVSRLLAKVSGFGLSHSKIGVSDKEGKGVHFDRFLVSFKVFLEFEVV